MPPPTRRLEGRHFSDRAIARGAVGVLAGLLVVGALLLGGSVLLGGGENTPARKSTASAAPSALPTVAVTTPPATSTPSPTPSTGLTEAAMTAFVGEYLASAAADPAAAWAMLTPAFKRASGGFGSYRRFWGPVTSATPSGVFADPGTGRVTYRVDYVRSDGSRVTDSTRIRLVEGPAGQLLIDGEG